jgi:hypothetical protein
MSFREKLTPREKLTEVAEKLFPGSIPVIEDVVDSLIENGEHALYQCAIHNDMNKHELEGDDVPLHI